MTGKKKNFVRWFRFRLEFALALLGSLLVRVLTRDASLKLGGWLGRRMCGLSPKRRRLAEENMRLALPALSEQELKDNVLGVFEHAGISGIEMLRLNRYRSQSNDLHRCFDLEGIEHLREAYDLGRGVLFLTGHVGFWEAGNFIVPELGLPFDVVAKPMRNPFTDRYVNRMRETYGARVLDSKKGARQILKSLQQGRCVAILLDQHISPPGAVQVDFFGRKAFTTTAITNMAMKFQIPVLPVFSQRLSDYRYRFVAEPMLLLENGDDPGLVTKNTQLLTDRIEAAIRKDVTQWFWMHRRWRDS